MRPLSATLVSIGVACALPTSSLILAQEQKAEAARAKAAAIPRPETKKRGNDRAPAPMKIAVPAKAAAGAMMERMMGGQAVFDPANRAAQVQQFTQQFRPILRAELRFARTVCEPTKEQRKLLAREGNQVLKNTVEQFVEFQQMMMRGAWRGDRAYPDPRKLIQDGLTNAVKANLSPEQSARYRAEVEKWAADQKQVAVRNLVARLDQDLLLSADQRDQLCGSLSSHWDDAWCRSLVLLMHDDPFYPTIPDQHVVPFLNATQKKAWHDAQRANRAFWGGPGLVAGLELEAEPEDDEPGAAGPAAPIPAALIPAVKP
jgi:hypothetical protein